MTRIFLSLVFVLAAMTASPADAKAPKQLAWPDLIPNQEPVKDPLAALPPDQFNDISNLILARNMLASGLRGQDKRMVDDEIAALDRKFKKRGVNVDKLFAEYKAFETEVTSRGKQLVGALNGSEVKIAGYLLPLEFSDKGTTEFLLVPYVGACIHVPPPPPNQIVFVHLKNPYQVQDLFAPVQITGRMSTKSSSRNLSFMDGTAPIDVGYSLAGEAVANYQE